jgi:uncharacterized protein YidB (DUF937 family)
MASNIFGSDESSAVPGGNVAKPLMLALLALLAARYFGGGKSTDAPKPAEVPSGRDAGADESPGSILDGLGGLLEQFQKKGLGDTVDSWIKTGANKDISSGQVKEALGGDMVDELARRTGLSRDQVLNELARMLPSAVDRMTPGGRLPTRQELQQLLG